MSKELEALEGIKLALAKHLSKDTGVSVEKHLDYLENDTQIETITKALTLPTADEVCKVLSEIEGVAVRYEANSQAFINKYEHTLVVMMDSGLLLRLYDTYPASVITLIGRFYQSLEEVEHERD